MAMNRARRTSNLNNILTYDTLGNSTLIANLTVEGLTGAGFVKADAAGLLSVDTAAYTVTTGATNYLPKITAPNTLGQSLVYDNGTSVLVNTAVGVPGYSHAFQVMANGAGGLVVSTTDVASAIGIVNSSSANKTWDISPYGNHLVINESGIATRMKFDAGGNITIGDITNSGHKLEVVGSFRTTGTNTLSALQGVGDRMVVANTNGVLTTQAIPTGNITGTGAAGQVTYWTGASAVSGSNNLFWDNTNGRLGIGTNAPLFRIDVQGNSNSAQYVNIKNSNSGNAATSSYQLQSDTNTAALFLASSTYATFGVLGANNLGLYVSNNANIVVCVNSTGYFGIGTGASTPTEKFRVFNNGNVLIQNGGTFTDLGVRLGVVGDTLLRGSGATSATTALTVQNSSSTNLFSVRNDGLIRVGDSGSAQFSAPQIYTSFSDATLNLYGPTLVFSHRTATGGGFFYTGVIYNATSGSNVFIDIARNIEPTSGTASFSMLQIRPSINQTGGANGITRGLYVNPNLALGSGPADWRSIEWSNNSGWGLYGAGTASNYLAGSLGIGTSTLAAKLTVVGASTVIGQTNVSARFSDDINSTLLISHPASTGAAATITGNEQLAFATGAVGSIAERVRINATGSVGIGTTTLTGYNLRISKNITGSITSGGITVDGIIQSGVTTSAWAFSSLLTTQAATFNLTHLSHFSAELQSIGAGSTITNQYGFYAVSNLVGATNNYGFYGNIASGTGRWNLYMNGTADNYLAGNLGLGVTPSAWDTTYKVYEAPGNAFVAGFSGQIQIGQNAYYSGGWKYKTTAVASKYYQVNGTHVWQTAPSGIIDTSITYTQAMTLDASGNLGIGVTPTVRLQVSGDTLLRGSGATSATTALTVQNSAGTNMWRFLNDGDLLIGTSGVVTIRPNNGTITSPQLTGLGMTLNIGLINAGSAVIINNVNGERAATSGISNTLLVQNGFSPASGTGQFNMIVAQGTINQTGGANGITRGLYVNPTLTAAADWRSIQWDNNTGYGLYGEGTAPNLIKGNLIIGPSALNQVSADSSLHIGKAMNAQSSYGSTIRYEAQNGVIAAHALNINLSTQDAAFTISNIYGVSVLGTIKGASNTITNQYGFFVNSTFIGATNNYAYWGDIPAGANTWNLYMNGGANNYLAGSLGIGSNALTGYGFRNNKQLTGSSTSIGNGAEGQIQTGVSVAAYYYRTISNQIVGTSTTSIIHYGATQGTLSGVSNNQYGFYAFDLSVSTANYGFYGALTSGANKWNLYMSGTANNYMNGALLLGNTTTDGANKLQVTGSSALNGVTYVNTNASIAGYGHSLQVLANASGGMIVSTTNSASAIGIVNSASSNKTWDISPFNNDLSFNESGVGTRMYLSAGGRIGLGIAPVTLDNATVTIGGNVTTGTGPSALLISPTVQSTATSSAVYSLVRSSTQAASFVLPSLFYYFTSEGTFGAGSSVTSQYGYYANGNMTGATNNYGFYGAIPAGTGRWNLYMNGDAHNYLAGNVGIGSGGTSDLVKLYIVGSTTGTTIYNFAYAQPQISTSLSSGLFVFRSNVSGTGTASTTESITHFIAQQSSLGSATVTNQYGFRVDTGLTGATNNYGFYGNIASAANRWNLYMAGTALNHLNGTTLIGTATDDGVNKLQVAGSIKAAGVLRSDITQAAVTNNVSISLLGSNITTYAAGFSMANAGYGLNGVYAQHEQRFGGNATFAHGNINGAGLMLNKLAPTAAGTVTITQQTGQLRTMSNLHLMTQFEGNNNLTVTDMSGLHIYGHYRTSGTGTLTVSNAYYGIFLADPNEFGTGATITGTNWGFYQQGTAPINAFEGSMLVGTTTTDANNRLVVSGNTRVTGNTTSAQFRLSALNTAPATSTSTGTTGEIVIDANHIYVCTATNTWKRVAIATF